MKKQLQSLSKKALLLAVFTASVSFPVMSQDINQLKESDYSIPSWTVLKAAVNNLKSSELPYCINMTVNGDPSSQLGFAWFTNQTSQNGTLQIVNKENAAAEDFLNPDYQIQSTITDAELNYLNSSKNAAVITETGIEANTKRNYTSHKALAKGLAPATTYSFRVGKEGSWSEIGTFTTAPAAKDGFSFIYITDTQANTKEMFDISQKTVHTAKSNVPDARFLLCNGDFVETSGSSNSEWEWEQWFSTMQDVWMTTPIIAVQGNHDTSSNNNFFLHFNTDDSFNKRENVVTTAMDGTVYSFIYGDALFMVINYEDWRKEGYFNSLKEWMKEQVEINKDVKWRIATYHKNMFTGSRSHQDDNDGKTVRENMLEAFDELKIDLALQGHDHIYEVLGPVKNISKSLIASGIEQMNIVSDGNERENMTGKQGGVFNVYEGTLYFLNNSAGKKKYEPRDEDQMIASYDKHEVENYWGLFSGKFGQTGEATFSKVNITSDEIEITTYTVNADGKETEFDSFKVIKEERIAANADETKTFSKSKFIQSGSEIIFEGEEINKLEIYSINGSLLNNSDNNILNISGVVSGTYIVKAISDVQTFSEKVVIN